MKIIKNSQTGCSLLTECGVDEPIFLSDVYKKHTQAKKYQSDAPQCGRSMVEMLGVLAIIGVLSVGAVAGYSKAMMKYKLNKQTEQLNTTISTMARHTKSFEGLSHHTYLAPLFNKMNEIPKEMIKDSSNYIYDIFNTKIELFYQDSSGKYLIMVLYPEIHKKSERGLEVCKNIILTAKEHSDSLRNLQTISSSSSGATYSYLQGDSYCTTSTVCLKSVSLDDIYKACTAHLNQENSHIKLVWDAI